MTPNPPAAQLRRYRDADAAGEHTVAERRLDRAGGILQIERDVLVRNQHQCHVVTAAMPAKLTSHHRFCDAPNRLEHLANPRRSRRTASSIACPHPVAESSRRSCSENRPTCRTRRDIDESPSSPS
jgi:hypothetical protein